ncbi:hypothetical protein V5N11_021062 [Cardamine amara subsp. amara]|uniref:Transmembrane protein n=1 Tax=Cardamine amara subsp. amara TaxID=228776 RepID=A0ABD1BT94_CARAN
MDQMVLGEQDLEVDIEAGRSDVKQESTSDSERVDFGVPEKIADDLNYPLIRHENLAETSSQSLDLSDKKCDSVKFKKSRKASKPPRPPKSPSLIANDHKVMREIAELAMRKRARIERMKNSLRRIKAAKSSSSSSSSSQCISIFSLVVTALFFFFLVFQGFFAGNSSLSTDKSPAPNASPNNQMISVQFYNEFAPVEQTDPSPTTSFRYTRKRVSGAEEEDSRDFTR